MCQNCLRLFAVHLRTLIYKVDNLSSIVSMDKLETVLRVGKTTSFTQQQAATSNSRECVVVCTALKYRAEIPKPTCVG